MEQNKEYYAFISYKREDEKWAKWLQDKLEHYKFPTNLNGRTDLPKNIRPTFRDVTDSTPGLLAEEINNALCNSEWLIVICSPRAAKSPWVCKEAQTFIDLGRADHIIPFVIEGNPFSSDTATECYPEALLKLTGSNELLAANINEMGRDAAAIKVVACMFNLRFDALWQRYEREQRKRRCWIVAATILAFLCISGIAFWMYWQKQQTQMANWKMMENQTRAVTEKALEVCKNGDVFLAELLLLEVLPKDLENPERPYVTEAESALRAAEDEESSVLCRYHQLTGNYCVDSKLISNGYEKDIDVWNPEDGKLIKHYNSESVYFATYSPNRKEIAIAFGKGGSSSDVTQQEKNILIIDSKSGKRRHLLKGHTKEIISFIYSSNGKYLVSTAWDGTVRLWDVEREKCIRIFSEGFKTIPSLIGERKTPQRSSSLGFSPNGKFVATNFKEGRIEIWDTMSGECIDILKSHLGPVWSICYSPDGRYIATAGDDKDIRIWSAEDRKLLKLLKGHTKTIWNVSFSKNSKYLVSSSSDSTIRIWDVVKGECLKYKRFRTDIMRASFSEDGSKVFFSPNDKSVRMWKLSDVPSFFANRFYNHVFNQKNNIVVLVESSNLNIWDVKNQKSLLSLVWTRADGVDYCESNNCILVVSNSWKKDAKIRVWNVNTRTLVKELPFKETGAFGGSKSPAVFSPDGKNIASVGGDSIVHIWDVMTGHSIRSFKKEEYDILRYSSDGMILAATVGWKREVSLIRIQDGKTIRTLSGHKREINNILFTKDGNFLITSAYDEEIKIWDIKTGKCIKSITLGLGYISGLALSKDDKYIISISNHSSISIVDRETGISMRTVTVEDASFSYLLNDNRTLIVASSGGKISYYDFPPFQEVINNVRERFKNRQLTQEERRKYYLE